MAKPATKSSTKPATKAAKPAPVEEVETTTEEETTFGVADIAELIKVETGKEVKTRDLRTLLRKMARDGRLDREIVAGNRERWSWTGPEDPEVAKITEAYANGELDADKKEKLDALKKRKEQQRAEKKAAAEAAEAEAGDEAEGDDEELEA
jgi:hypothetical protein